MSITKDLLLYFIECKCDEWLYEYFEGSIVIVIESNCDEQLYEYRRIYCCILWNVIMMISCMSITKDLLLYFIECKCDEQLYEYFEGSTIVVIESNCDEQLYEYYKESTIVFYGM